ncbi:hypothetical protein J6590_032996 [Homalodisca vitripennis]|nr:hypothetical protein J6590_032996 [Homalodisca vitripennis]
MYQSVYSGVELALLLPHSAQWGKKITTGYLDPSILCRSGYGSAAGTRQLAKRPYYRMGRTNQLCGTKVEWCSRQVVTAIPPSVAGLNLRFPSTNNRS